MLESDLQTTSASLEQELNKGVEREEELQVLRNCLHQVIEKVEPQPNGGEEEGEEGVDGRKEGEGEEGEVEGEVKVDKEAQLRKIEAMLDTTKVSLVYQSTYI